MATTLGNGNITFGDGTTLSTASMIQSIQRGTVYASYPYGSNGVVNISAVVTAKCMVIVTGAGINGYFNGAPYFTTFNSTTQFSWLFTSSATYPTCAFGWQVIEFK